jgi:thiol:disulfide interchange protein
MPKQEQPGVATVTPGCLYFVNIWLVKTAIDCCYSLYSSLALFWEDHLCQKSINCTQQYSYYIFMKHTILLLSIIVLSGTLPSCAQKSAKDKKTATKTASTVDNTTLHWNTDVMKAMAISNTQHKPIFAFFTGSDWCGWCHKLERAVFEKPEFIKWANEKVVLLELDFPRNKTLSPELQQQNAGLQQAFQVQGYPTIWFFYLSKNDSTKKMDISPLGSLGYPGDAEVGNEQVKFIHDADMIIAKGKQ